MQGIIPTSSWIRWQIEKEAKTSNAGETYLSNSVFSNVQFYTQELKS